MLDQRLHKKHLNKILLKLYRDTTLASLLGFKGGTAAYLFYDLPRASVDLDFDLLRELDKAERKELMEKITSKLEKEYKIKEKYDKRYTLFWLLSYKKGKTSIKIEMSKRGSGSRFEEKVFYGVKVPVMVLEDSVANKMMALVDRKKFANRDVFDVWYFLGLPEVEVNEKLIKEKLGINLKQLYQKILKRVNKKRGESYLAGMGELLSEEQKVFVREEMIEELNQLIKVQLDS